MESQYDMIVIGAGWYGLGAAKTYLQLHPAEEVLVLEAESSSGGTWSEGRLYPGLKSNNLVGSYEFPDFPMKPYGIKETDHIPGTVLHRYLTDFAKHFGVFARTRFETKVDSLEAKDDGSWSLKTTSGGKERTLNTKKVIVATGLTSLPNFPTYPGAETFNAPYFHAKDFCRQSATVQPGKNIVVVGGAKSAMDVAWAYADAGSTVDMVIRPTGNGPVWISYPYVMGGKKLEKLLHVRWMQWFSPCPFAGEDGWQWPRWFLHATWIGRFLTEQFWAGLAGEVVQANGYDSHPETKKLKPWHPAFWTASALSIFNYDSNFLDMVKSGAVKVHIAEVDRLTNHAVHLSDGQTLQADALICATGWRKESSIRFSNFNIGLPHTPTEQRKLASDADSDILLRYPKLEKQPILEAKAKADPLRLYRFIVPPNYMEKRTIAFAGMVSSVSTAISAAVQGLWISAYLDGRLDREAASVDEVTKEIMLHTQWGKWRYPTGYGASLPDFAFDAVPYIDLLVKDLGLKVNRKEGWFTDMTTPYGPEDYTTLMDEWVLQHERRT